MPSRFGGDGHEAVPALLQLLSLFLYIRFQHGEMKLLPNGCGDFFPDGMGRD
jgi:hypothetical protein